MYVVVRGGGVGYTGTTVFTSPMSHACFASYIRARNHISRAFFCPTWDHPIPKTQKPKNSRPLSDFHSCIPHSTCFYSSSFYPSACHCVPPTFHFSSQCPPLPLPVMQSIHNVSTSFSTYFTTVLLDPRSTTTLMATCLPPLFAEMESVGHSPVSPSWRSRSPRQSCPPAADPTGMGDTQRLGHSGLM